VKVVTAAPFAVDRPQSPLTVCRVRTADYLDAPDETWDVWPVRVAGRAERRA
jgi:hypothetical protein